MHVKIVIIACITLLLAVSAMVSCTAYQNYLISSDVQRGADPILAACAHSTDHMSTECMQYATGKK